MISTSVIKGKVYLPLSSGLEMAFEWHDVGEKNDYMYFTLYIFYRMLINKSIKGSEK